MKTLGRLPKTGSKIRYLGGYTVPNCDLVLGEIYEVRGITNTSTKDIEYAYVAIDEDSHYTWYIKGHGDGEDNDFDKFELVEECLSREDLITLNNEKDKVILGLKKSLEDLENDIRRLHSKISLWG